VTHCILWCNVSCVCMRLCLFSFACFDHCVAWPGVALVVYMLILVDHSSVPVKLWGCHLAISRPENEFGLAVNQNLDRATPL